MIGKVFGLAKIAYENKELIGTGVDVGAKLIDLIREKELKVVYHELKKLGVDEISILANNESKYIETVKDIYRVVIPLIPPPVSVVISYGLDEDKFVNYCLKHRPLVLKMFDESIEEGQLGHLNDEEIISESEIIERLKIFINLIKCDGKLDKSEIAFINEAILTSNLPLERQIEIKSSLLEEISLDIDYTVFKNDISKENIINDLIFVSKIDDDFDSSEQEFVIKIGAELGYTDTEINRKF